MMTTFVRIRSFSLVWAAVLMVGCSSMPNISMPSIPGFGKKAAPAAAPASAATAAPAVVEEPAPAPAVHRSESEIKQMLEVIRNLLDQGQEDNAQDELQKILASDTSNKVAQGFMRQIKDDPVALYGRESFTYKVGQGDTLASIAQRFMNDRDQFYGLARYNGIKVPRQLQLGQAIRVPGKQPRNVAPPVKTDPKPEPVVVTPPPAPVVAAPAPAPDPAAEAAKAEREKKTAIDRGTKSARAAMARQDVCGAIANWDAVLKVDPNNLTAQLERQKALELKKKLPAAKC
jgi:tetratricopeptide (TPR) repeat protein